MQPLIRRTRPSRVSDARHRARGFSMVELLIVLAVFALLVAMAIPGYASYVASHRLRGSVENLASQVRLARERAMTVGVDQPVHFYENLYDADFHVHAAGVVSYRWSLPRGVHYAASNPNVTMRKDGTASSSMYVVLRDDRGEQDTLSILTSGIVLTR